MTLAEFMEKMEEVVELARVHNLSPQDVEVKIFGERGVPSRVEVRQDRPECLTQVVVNL